MSSVPPLSSIVDLAGAVDRHSRSMAISEACSVIERQAQIETAFLMHFVNEPMPGGMDRLRPEQVEHTLRLIAAMSIAIDVARKVSALSPVARELLGVKP